MSTQSFSSIILVTFALLTFTLSAKDDDSASTSEVNHVVLCWLKNPENQKDIETLIATGERLKQIEGILELKMGKPIKSERPIVDDSFDFGFYMRFADAESMQRYLNHPLHKQAVQEILLPLTAKVIIYDF